MITSRVVDVLISRLSLNLTSLSCGEGLVLPWHSRLSEVHARKGEGEVTK